MLCSTRINNPKNLEHVKYAVSRFHRVRLFGLIEKNGEEDNDRNGERNGKPRIERNGKPRIERNGKPRIERKGKLGIERNGKRSEPGVWKNCYCLKTDGVVVTVNTIVLRR